MEDLEKKIFSLLKNHERKQKTALSRKYPILKKPVSRIRCILRHIRNLFNSGIKTARSDTFFPYVIACYESPLRRKSGDHNPGMQDHKIVNIKRAIEKLNGIIIYPEKIFSFWHIIGNPDYSHGYVDGVMLSDGKIIESAGGGLCQLSNFIYELFLNVPAEVIEEHNHSGFAFPDSGIVTVYYNYFDLRIKNKFSKPIQLKIWTADDLLKAQILSHSILPEKINIKEKNFCFIKKGKIYFRYKEICKEIEKDGKLISAEKVKTEFLPVFYGIDDEYILKNNYKCINIMP